MSGDEDPRNDEDAWTGDGDRSEDEAGDARKKMEDRPAIRELDEATIERIAAGEVVKRPASVVKELVENSLDADASRLRVVVENGGKDGIRVTDDGVGMDEADVRAAVEKHTTSKITDIADVEAGVASLGFRGEALSSIGAVSRTTIRTKPRGGARGTELRIEGGDVLGVESAGCPGGTTVAVEDLFYNVPARRKYLKQTSTEFSHVNRVVTGYALANPEVAVALEHDGNEVFSTTGQGRLEGTILAVYGREVAEAMIPVEPASRALDGANGSTIDGPLDDLSGMVSHPETVRSTPANCSIYVNGRYVRAKTVRDAILDAYGDQLGPDRYPFAVFFLSVPADTIDVNVHPRKQEVRFADEAGVRDQVEAAVEAALVAEGLLRSGAPRGRSAPDQTEITPENAADEPTDPGERDDQTGPERSTARDATGHHENTSTADPPASRETTAETEHQSDYASGFEFANHSEEASTASDIEDTTASRGPENPLANEPSWSRDDASAAIEPTDDPESATTHRAELSTDRHDADRKFTGENTQATLDGERVADTPEFDRLPRLRVLGQAHDTYLLCESPDGLVLIDQHAADERINYERLRERFAGETTTQELAEPVELELTAGEAAVFADQEAALVELGFRASLVGPDDRIARLTGVPSLVAEAADPDLLRDALSSFVAGEEAVGTVEAATETLLGDLACYPSITANESLSAGSVLDLLSALDACENPYACPHGRPVLIEVSHAELEDRFERDYPGHAGRRSE